jgi:hypothetical protein
MQVSHGVPTVHSAEYRRGAHVQWDVVKLPIPLRRATTQKPKRVLNVFNHIEHQGDIKRLTIGEWIAENKRTMIAIKLLT